MSKNYWDSKDEDDFLSVKNVYKTFKNKEVLKDISFKIGKKEIFTLIGESGSGKTTIANLILRTEKPSSGKISFLGKPIEFYHQKEYAKYVSFVFQNPSTSLNPFFTVEEAILEPLKILKLKFDKEFLEEVFKKLEIDKTILTRKVKNLSGGEKQRIAFIRALITKPKIIIADEPTSALDEELKESMGNLILKIKESWEISFLLITHDIEIATMVSDKISIILRGKLLEMASANKIKENPLHPYSNFLLSFENTKECKKLPKRKDASECPFYERCEKAFDKCLDQIKPKYVGDRYVYCALY